MLAKKLIDHSIKERNKQKVTQESRIEISADIMEQINKKHFYLKQKRRAFNTSYGQRNIQDKQKEKEKEKNYLHTSQKLKSQRKTKVRDKSH